MSVMMHSKGKSKPGFTVDKIELLVIYAAFGDATLIKVTDTSKTVHYYLVDGGPTTAIKGHKPYVFHNLLETLLKYTSKPDKVYNEFKLDGIMVTHPDRDHYEGVLELIKHFPPNKNPTPGKAKFDFVGPMLLTELFEWWPADLESLVSELKKNGFRGDKLVDGALIDGFEDQFTFYFPESKVPGWLYTYKQASQLFLQAPSLGSVPYVDKSYYNRSSTLLVIDDPDRNKPNPLISLNGDAVGYSVLKSLRNRTPVIFKVPHHGSVHNSIQLEKYAPSDILSTEKCFAAQSLLKLALKPTESDPVVPRKFIEEFETKYAEVVNTKTRSNRKIRALKLEPTLYDMAKLFNSMLANSNPPVNTSQILTVLEKQMHQIRDNSNNPAINSTQIYTAGMDQPQFGLLPTFLTMYGRVKKQVREKEEDSYTKEENRRLCYARSDVFSKLENDCMFKQVVEVKLSKEFYKQVNAQTYFISSGQLHDHPHWQVINGIIEAAVEKHEQDPNYKCRILVTTGNGILGDKLPNPEHNSWTKFVSLQYFAGETASVTLDPSETNTLKCFEGAIIWRDLSEGEKRTLKSDYNNVKGAIALKEKRQAKHNSLYYIFCGTSMSSINVVPSLDPSKSVIDRIQVVDYTQMAPLHVKQTGTIMENNKPWSISQRLAFKMSLRSVTVKKGTNKPVELYGILGYETPDFVRKTYNLFVFSTDGKRLYLVASPSSSAITTTTNFNEASQFRFGHFQCSQGLYSQTSIISSQEQCLSSLSKYITALGVGEDPASYSMYDVVMFLQGSESSGYSLMSSFCRSMTNVILDWKIDFEESSVEFLNFLTAPFVLSAKLVSVLPDDLSNVDLGINHKFNIKRASVIIPNTFDTSKPSFLFVEAQLNGKSVSLKSYSTIGDFLPCLEVKMVDQLSISDIFTLLNIPSSAQNYKIPLLSDTLKDNAHITEAGFTLQQGVRNSTDTYLSNVYFGMQFTKIDEFLPSSITNLKEITARVVLYQPTLPNIKVGFQVSFLFGIPVAVNDSKEVHLNADLQAEPTDASTTEQSSYNFSIALKADSDKVSTTGGVSLASLLEWFKLGSALQAAQSIPFISSLLTNAHLKQLVLGFSTNSKAIQEFSLTIVAPKWEIIPDKVVLEDFDAVMSYNSSAWAVLFRANAIFGGEYPITIQFRLPEGQSSATLSFKSNNCDFTIATFLQVFDLGSIQEVPVICQLLNIAVTEASLDFCTKNNSFAVSVGSISIYCESINIGSLFTLSQVNAIVGFSKVSDRYEFSFSVSGFINKKMYLTVSYDRTTSILIGQVKIADNEKANLSDALNVLIKNTEPVESNAVYGKVSKTFAADMSVAMLFKANDFKVTDLTVSLTNVLSIGTLSVERLQFEYHWKQSSTMYQLIGQLSDASGFSVFLEFNLLKNTQGCKAITASLSPTKKNSLRLRSFLSMLGVVPPELPPLEGQRLPEFLDLALTSGSITISIEPLFEIKGFHIEIETASTITLLESPVVQLEKVSLLLDYDKTKAPVPLTAMIVGQLLIGSLLLQLSGHKQTDGYVFQMHLSPKNNCIQLQESINKLTPTDLPSPALPTDVGLPKEIDVAVTTLTLKLLTTVNSIHFRAVSKLSWSINLGFQTFVIEKVGGALTYSKPVPTLQSHMLDSKQFTVYVVGRFNLSSSVQLDAELHFGPNRDSVLSILVTNPKDIQISSVADKTLGFNHSNDSKDPRISFQSLLPKTTHDIQLSSAYINVNLTQKVFTLLGQLHNLGYGFLVAGDFSNSQDNDRKTYGYSFCISLPDRFKFSDLLSEFSPIDSVLTVTKANCVVMAISNVTVSEVVTKMKAVEQAMIPPQTAGPISFPFSNLKLDNGTKNQLLLPGLSLYAELNFHNAPKGSLLDSINQISDTSAAIPNVTLSVMVSKDPKQSEFKAWVNKLTLLGLIQLTDIIFIYKPSSLNVFELHGTVALKIGSTSLNFRGSLTCSNVQSRFSSLYDPAHPITIHDPLGMFGISLVDAKLTLTYDYPKDTAPSSNQEVRAKVTFCSKSSSSLSSNDSSITPPISLTGHVIFYKYTPTVVKVDLETKKPLTIAEFCATVFKWTYNTDLYLNIKFVGGYMYYSKSGIKLDGIKYQDGFHISADTEIYDEVFTVQVDIPLDKSGFEMHGFTHKPIELLGFAKFTKIDSSDRHKSDVTKGPELSFTKRSDSTSLSLDVGLVLFGSPFGVANLGYRTGSDGKKKPAFFGKLTYSGDIAWFLKHPSITVEWNKQDGFQVTDWPAVESFAKAFDFFKKLRHFEGGCEKLVGLAFNKAVQTNVKFNIKPSKTSDKTKYVARIDIIGTYDISLAGKVKIGSIPLPAMGVEIRREDNFSLSKLPQLILDIFADYAPRIIEQFFSDPERLVKLLSLVALKNITKKVLQSLLCRGVKKGDIDPDQGGEDIGKDDMDNAKDAETDLENALGDVAGALSGVGASIAAAAGLAAAFESLFGSFIGVISAAIGVFAAISSIFTLGFYSEKKAKAEQMKDNAMKKQAKVQRMMEEALHIKKAPSTSFTAPNKLKLSWEPISAYQGAQYHVKITGLELGKTDQQHIPATFFDRTVQDHGLRIEKDEFYEAVALTVAINGTVTGSKDGKSTTYNGKPCTVVVQNVHPTLLKPQDVQITYDYKTKQIVALILTPVKYAKAYYFELIESDNTRIGHCTYTPSSKDSPIQCYFPHSDIPSVHKEPFKVRCQALAESEHGNISASSFTESKNSLSILKPVTDVSVSLPHYSTKDQMIRTTWHLPSEPSSLYACQIVEQTSGTILVYKELSKPTNFEVHILSCELGLEEILTNLLSHHLLPSAPNNILKLDIQVYAVSKKSDVIDSVFVTNQISSLESPLNVSFQFSAESDILQVSWTMDSGNSGLPSQFGIEILTSKSVAVWSKVVCYPQETYVDSGKICYKIRLVDLKLVNKPDMSYSIQVFSIATGNGELDSLLPGKAADSIMVFPPPIVQNLSYSSKDNTVQLSLKPVNGVSKYKAVLSTETNASVATKVLDTSSPDTQLASFPVDSFSDQLKGGDKLSGGALSLGTLHTLSSILSKFPKPLKIPQKPATVQFSYDTDNGNITLTCSPVEEISTYKLGYRDPSGHVPDICNENPSNKFVLPSSRLVGTEVRQWKGFAQAVIDSSQLPSPYSFLQETVHVLPPPANVSIKLETSNHTVLLVKLPRVQHAAHYQLDYSICSRKKMTARETFPQSSTDLVQVQIDINENLSHWMDKIHGCLDALLTMTITAIGSGYYITGNPSPPLSLSQANPPSGLSYSYCTNTPDIITLTCDTAAQSSSYSFGLKNGAMTITAAGKISDKIASGTIGGDNVREQGENDWTVFAQHNGDGEHFPNRATLQDHVSVLDFTTITSFEYNHSDDTLDVMWSAVDHAAKYTVNLAYISMTGSIVQDSKVVDGAMTETKLAAKKTSKLNYIECRVTAIGSGWYITGQPTGASVLRLTRKPENIQIIPTDCQVRVTWDKVSFASQYDVDFIINNKTMAKRRVPVNKCIVSKAFLFPPPAPFTPLQCITVNVTALMHLPGKSSQAFPSDQAAQSNQVLPIGIQTTSMMPSAFIYGPRSQSFDDSDVMMGNHNIIGIKSLIVYHKDSVSSLQAEYLLADGTTWTASKHGSESGTQSKFILTDQEFIVEVQFQATWSNSIYRIQQLVFITEKIDGSQTKYGPYGSGTGGLFFGISGRIMYFSGYKDQCINAIQLTYISLAPQIQIGYLFGGQNGTMFDDMEISQSHFPQVVNIRGLIINSDPAIGITFIQATYRLQDDTLWQADSLSHGSANVGDQNHLVFSQGEELTQVKGIKYLDEQSQETRVGQLTFVTSSDYGSLKTYGPYGRSSGDQVTFITGKIVSLYGRSSKYIDAIGFYYSFEKTEKFGNLISPDFDDAIMSHDPAVVGIRGLSVQHSDQYGFRGIQATYSLADGSNWKGPRNGGSKGTWTPIQFKKGEDIIKVAGKVISFGQVTLIGQLTIVTNHSTYGPFPSKCPNHEKSEDFECSGKPIIGFFGNCDSEDGVGVEALGVYYV